MHRLECSLNPVDLALSISTKNPFASTEIQKKLAYPECFWKSRWHEYSRYLSFRDGTFWSCWTVGIRHFENLERGSRDAV